VSTSAGVQPTDTPDVADKSAETSVSNGTTEPQRLPKLLDLGAGRCIPCKMMEPILQELKANYKGRMTVEFIDVWENPSAGETYQIRSIPTQIFYNPEGRELFRHEGFFSKEDILAKWRELGIEFPDSGK